MNKLLEELIEFYQSNNEISLEKEKKIQDLLYEKKSSIMIEKKEEKKNISFDMIELNLLIDIISNHQYDYEIRDSLILEDINNNLYSLRKELDYEIDDKKKKKKNLKL